MTAAAPLRRVWARWLARFLPARAALRRTRGSPPATDGRAGQGSPAAPSPHASPPAQDAPAAAVAARLRRLPIVPAPRAFYPPVLLGPGGAYVQPWPPEDLRS